MTAPARRAIAAVCGALVACLCWIALGPAKRIDARTSQSPRVSKTEADPTLRLIGVCELAAGELTEVRLPLAAPLVGLAAPGESVTKGQALGRQDRQKLALELRQAESALERAQAQAASREAECLPARQAFRVAEARQKSLQDELERLEREAGAAGKLYREQASRADRAAEEAWEKFRSVQRRWRQTEVALTEAGSRLEQARTKLEQAEKRLADARAALTAARQVHDQAARRIQSPDPAAPCAGRVRRCQVESGMLLVSIAREDVLVGQLQPEPAFAGRLPDSCPVRIEGETGGVWRATLAVVGGRGEIRVANPAGQLQPGTRVRVFLETGP